MPIEIQQPGLAELYATAALLSKEKAEARTLWEKQQEKDRIETLQLQQQHQRNMKLLDSQLDLEMYERSKRWEIDKMELRSRLDFEREEGERRRKLDDIDNAMRQIDREVELGRITEEQAQPLRFSYEMKRYGAAPPVSLIKPPREEREEPIKRTDIDAAIRFLKEYEEKKAKKWYQLTAPKVTAEEEAAAEFYRNIIEDITPSMAGVPTGIPRGTISQGLPTPKTQAEYDRIPVGSQYIDSSGNIRTKS